jgi:hypothetical protein
MKRLLCIIGFLFAAIPAKGNNVYLANTAQGSGTGLDCNNAVVYTYFNTTGNWTTGTPTGIQIGPGTTVHICGGLTPAAGVQALIAHGSGTSGNPVTIHFESGATITSPYFNGNGEIYISGRSWIVIDGNRTTGAYMGATDNGSAAAGYHNQRGSSCINAGNTTNVTIENLVCQNMYVHVVTSPDDEAINQAQVSALTGAGDGPTTNLTINNCHFTQMGWSITTAAVSGEVIEFTEFDHVDHGLADGGGTTGANSNISIHDNHFHDFANWDTSNDHYHHDGIHMWGGDNVNAGKGYHSNVSVYNNLFDGDSGGNMTSWIYFENDIQSSTIFNNVIIPSTTNIPANGWINFGGRTGDTIPSQNNAEYNNTIIGNNPTGNACYWSSAESNLTFENNIGMGCQTLFTTANTTVTFATFDYNTWENMNVDHGDTRTFNINNIYYATLAQWQAACNCDAHSQSASSSAINLNSSGHPQAGSDVIGFGTNLTSKNISALDKDKAGVARPATGAWDDGAYQYGSTHQISKVQVINPAAVHASSLTAALPTETAGNFLIAATAYQLPGTTVTVTDTLGNTWTQLSAYNNSVCGNTDGNYSGAQLWYAENIKGGANTVKMQVNAATYIWIAVVEYSGIKTSGSLAASNGFVASTSSSSISAGNVTATGTNNLIFGFFHDEFQNTSMTAGSGYVDEANASLTAMIEDNISAAMGTYNPSANYTNGSDACGVATDAAFSSQ